MGNQLATIRLKVAPHSEHVARLIEKIEAGGKFEVVAGKSENTLTLRIKR